MNNSMTSSKPYLIRAIYEWIVDNNLTPYIAVDTSINGTTVPREYVEDERIVLNISPISTSNLIINNDAMEFKTRFNGVSHNIYIPIPSVMVIYAQENNQGMAFQPEEYDSEQIEKQIQPDTLSKSKPKLKLVTGENEDQ